MGNGKISAKQEEILHYIKDTILMKGYPPTVREICDISEIKSTSTVHKYIKRLENLGYINKKDNSPRSIRLTGKI